MTIQDRQRGLGVADQRVDEGFPGCGVVPVARWFTHRGVVIVAGQPRPYRGRQRRVGAIGCGEHGADACPHLDDRVLGGHRVEERGGIQNSASAPQQSGRPRGGVDVVEQPPRSIRSAQPVAHPDQHGGMESPRAHRQPRRSLPPQIERQPVARLPIREPLIGLQQHHRGHHPGRYRRAPQRRAFEQINEILITEQRRTMHREQPIHTALGEPIIDQQHHVIEPDLPILTSQSHPTIFTDQPTKPARARRKPRP